MSSPHIPEGQLSTTHQPMVIYLPNSINRKAVRESTQWWMRYREAEDSLCTMFPFSDLWARLRAPWRGSLHKCSKEEPMCSAHKHVWVWLGKSNSVWSVCNLRASCAQGHGVQSASKPQSDAWARKHCPAWKPRSFAVRIEAGFWGHDKKGTFKFGTCETALRGTNAAGLRT